MSKKKPEKVEIKTFEDLKEALNDAERMEAAYNEQAAEDQRLSEVLTAASELVPSEEEIDAAKKARIVIDLDRKTRKVEEEKPAEPQQVEMKLAADKHHIDPNELKEELKKEEPKPEEKEELAKYPMKSCVGIISDGFMYNQDPKTYGTYHWIENEHNFGHMCQTIPERKTEIKLALIDKGFITERGDLDDAEILKKYLEEYEVSEKTGRFITMKIDELDEEFKEIVTWEIRYAVLLKTTEKTADNLTKFGPAPDCVYRPADIVKLLAA